jgi:D-alanyl-lipoteichoic acid acyltransferase DltB (MBOAT superfamily)
MLEAWLGLSAYTIQIYFDFAGYSNMAIGLALALGFAFPRNFNLPYTSCSITEFWRRWHISLSQWMRDYLYIPLGGNRGSNLDTYRNLCIVFVFCGLWHGANWTFVIWGLHHGAFLVLERMGLGAALSRAPTWTGRVYALLVVMAGWVWFRAHDAHHALSFFASLAGAHGAFRVGTAMNLVLHWAAIAALVIGAVLALMKIDVQRLFHRLAGRAHNIAYGLADTGTLALLFALSIVSVAAGSYSPFLYFRF